MWIAAVAGNVAIQRSTLDPTKIIITGAKGRMGQTLVACAERNPHGHLTLPRRWKRLASLFATNIIPRSWN